MDHVFANWRLGQPEGIGADGKSHANLKPADGMTLFETIEKSELPSSQTYILKRTELCFALLNVFPYTPGHLMVLPKRPIPCLDQLNAQEYVQIWEMVRHATIAVKQAFNPHGLNIGVNEGVAGGGSEPDHLHIHVVPRWTADTNFMSTTANTRVLPLSLADSYDRIIEAWPA